MLLSGEEQDGAIGVELLQDIRSAFGDDDVIRSSDLVAKLTADPERPWAEWKHGRHLPNTTHGISFFGDSNLFRLLSREFTEQIIAERPA